jgi:hypothetical protein
MKHNQEPPIFFERTRGLSIAGFDNTTTPRGKKSEPFFGLRTHQEAESNIIE